jgi:hypothetical protein
MSGSPSISSKLVKRLATPNASPTLVSESSDR